MSGAGAWQAGDLKAHGLRVAIVAGTWHRDVVDSLVSCAMRECERVRADATVTRVPGAFEIPLVCDVLAPDVDALVALAAVVRGGTPHFDYVCRAVTDGLVHVSLECQKPIGFGILTCDTSAQARDRCGLPGSSQNKGAEAAHSAIKAALVIRELLN